MEDPNMLAADCVVICCCCQCLILQILILILLRLPRKLVLKTKEYAKRKLRRSKRGEKTTRSVQHQEPDEFFVLHGESLEVQADAADICDGNCLQDVEVIMEKLSQDGEFGFGSFWGQMESRSFPSIASYQELETGLLHYQLIELVTTFRHQ